LSEREPDQEELARQLEEQLRKLKIEDVLINALMTVSSIGYRRLGATLDTREDRDLEQSRLAIETMRALTPVLEKVAPAELIRDFNQSIANLQLAYAQAASEPAAAGAAGGETGPAGGESDVDDDSQGRDHSSGERPEREEADGDDTGA
jgi:hypothetical protein